MPDTVSPSMDACSANSGETAYDLPSFWDGTCTKPAPGVSFSSLVVSPTQFSVQEDMCEPTTSKPTSVQGGETIAVTCSSLGELPDGKCPEGVCAWPKVNGFKTCLINPYGDLPCPDGWSDKHIYYDESEFCRCSCSDPEGQSCDTKISVYSDGACSKLLGSSAVSTNTAGACINVPAGSTLGSVSATPVTYKSGKCQPSLSKADPWTLCCLP